MGIRSKQMNCHSVVMSTFPFWVTALTFNRFASWERWVRGVSHPWRHRMRQNWPIQWSPPDRVRNGWILLVEHAPNRNDECNEPTNHEYRTHYSRVKAYQRHLLSMESLWLLFRLVFHILAFIYKIIFVRSGPQFCSCRGSKENFGTQGTSQTRQVRKSFVSCAKNLSGIYRLYSIFFESVNFNTLHLAMINISKIDVYIYWTTNKLRPMHSISKNLKSTAVNAWTNNILPALCNTLLLYYSCIRYPKGYLDHTAITVRACIHLNAAMLMVQITLFHSSRRYLSRSVVVSDSRSRHMHAF